MRKIIRTEKLDMETVVAIRIMCKDHAMKLSDYYERSALNAPGDGRLSYMAFLAAIAGGGVTPEQEARVARSLGNVRQELRKEKRGPVLRDLSRLLTRIAGEGDVELFRRGEITILRRVLGRAERLLDKNSAKSLIRKGK